MMDLLNDSRPLCPYPWISLSLEPDESLRVCCYGGEKRKIVNANKTPVFINQINNTDDLINHDYMANIRKEMLSGVWPELCRDCYLQELDGGVSPRKQALVKYHHIFLQYLKNTNLSGQCFSKIHHVDLSLGNKCNHACRMCSPYFSSILATEWKQLGLTYSHTAEERARNFFKEIPKILRKEIWENCNTICLQGGEPFISPLHDVIIDLALASARSKEISLDYISNMSTLPKVITEKWKLFSSVHIGISIEGVGNVQEYIRYRSIWNNFSNNIDAIIKMTHESDQNIKLSFLTVIQAYNLSSIPELLNYLRRFGDHIMPVPSFVMLRSPQIFRAHVLPKHFRQAQIFRIRQAIAHNMSYYRSCKHRDSCMSELQRLGMFLHELSEAPENTNEYYKFLLITKRFDHLRHQSITAVLPELFSSK